MNDKFTARQQIFINASISTVWKALVTPELIKQYLFGTDVESDWKTGSPITYRGIWNGKTYEDKGKILAILPEKLFESTYWSSMGGQPDIPENYKKVTYQLISENNGTRLSLIQDNNASEDEKIHSEGNWKMVLEGMKELLEK